MILNKKTLACFLLLVFIYFLLAYHTPRPHTWQLIFLFFAAFAGYLLLIRQAITFRQGFFIALIFRLVFIMAIPSLSDDYFRFIWDGALLINKENPYLHLPAYYLQNTSTNIPGITSELYHKLNSPAYFSVYPPVCQAIFGLARWLANENILLNCIWLRFFMLAAEAGTIILLTRLLRCLHLPEKRVWLYAFNPLVIVELTGNLHFEALLIFFLVCSLYSLFKNRVVGSAAALGLAIGVKLLPLIFLPFLYRHLGFKGFSKYILVVGVVLFLIFAPFISFELVRNIFSSINLYFQKFEFNASIYYLLRWLGYRFVGYNLISFFGPLLSVIILISVIMLAFRYQRNNQELISNFLLVLSLYFFLATVVHPWYLTTLVALAVVAQWRFPIAWSGLAILSYAAYQTEVYHENLYLVGLEYLLVYGILFYEIIQKKKLKQSQTQ